MPKLFNLKVGELRKHGYRDVEDWLSRPGHLYIGRQMRIFIYTNISTRELPGTKVSYTNNTKTLIRPKKNDNIPYCKKLLSMDVGSYVNKNNKIVKRYLIPQSKWHNPFRVNKSLPNSLGSTLDNFTKYFNNNKLLQNSLHELDNISGIGCWCTPNPCHGNVILNAYYKYKYNNQNKTSNDNKLKSNNTSNNNTLDEDDFVWGSDNSSNSNNTLNNNNTLHNYFKNESSYKNRNRNGNRNRRNYSNNSKSGKNSWVQKVCKN